MLVLTRRTGEAIEIGKGVFITCLGTNEQGEMVLGFDAPRNIPIKRIEVKKRKNANFSNKKN